MAVIGDSVPWGQGLRNEQKIHNLVTAALSGDPVKNERRIACDRFETDFFRRQQCYRASAGHPNQRGAAEYAAAVLAALR